MEDMTDLSPVQRVMRLNPHAIAADGGLKPFSQQYGEYALKKEVLTAASAKSVDKILFDYTPFVISWDCSRYGVPGIESRPLVLSKRTLDHIADRHSADVDFLITQLDKLSGEMSENVLAFQDKTHPSHIVFLLSEFSRNGNRLTTTVGIDSSMKTIEVTSIRTVHGNSHLISDLLKAASKDRQFFINERTGAWLENQQYTDRSPSAVLQRHLLEAYYTHLSSSDGFYKADVIDDPLLKSFVECADRDEMGNLIGLDEPMAEPYEGPSLEVIEFEKSLEAIWASIIRPCAEEARRAGECR